MTIHLSRTLFKEIVLKNQVGYFKNDNFKLCFETIGFGTSVEYIWFIYLKYVLTWNRNRKFDQM